MDFTIVAIARGITKKQIKPAFEAIVKGGITLLEVTMNTLHVLDLIKSATDHFKKQALIGAGTVCTLEEMHQALDAGAQFIVSPIINIKIVEYCHSNKIPVYPGALTPTEIYQAWNAGATMVKVFPVNRMGGADYIKDIKGPLDSIKLLACNGVNIDNCNDYLDKGADGIALASQLFNKEWLASGEYSKITAVAKQFSRICGNRI